MTSWACRCESLRWEGGLGGTWYWNRYPGARCDSESHSYQYYFSEELLKEWEWSERYPEQSEILRYLNHVAQKFNLYPDIQFNTSVSKAAYDKIKNIWHVYTESGECFSAKYLVTAVGCIASANVPQIDGLNTFDGNFYHTAKWPHEGVDFKGKHVGLIGTGSTGIQAIPVIAEQAASLTVFQRTANYSVPARNAPLSDEFKQYVKENSAQIRDIMHSNHNGLPINRSDRSVFDCTEEERNAIYEEAWNQGGMQFRATFRDLLSDHLANATAANFIKSKIKSIVNDSVTADTLADIDHPFAAKRPPIDTNYFETFNRDNVSIVNLRKTPIEKITPMGIQTYDKHFEFDVIVFATGFDAITGPLLKLNIQGSDGLKLADVWQHGPRSYLGLQVPGFPNLFTITGPGSPRFWVMSRSPLNSMLIGSLTVLLI